MIHIPDPLAKVTVRSMNLLWVDELPIGGNDIELVLINADLQLVMGTGMDEVDPDPFMTLRCLEHLQWREGLLAGLLVGVQVLIWLHLAAERIPPWATYRLNELWWVAEGPALVVENDGVAAPRHDASVSVHHEENIHRLGVPVTDHDVMRISFCLFHCLNVMF